MLIKNGLRGNELANNLSETLDADSFISSEIFRNKLFYHIFRTKLITNEVNVSFPDIPNQAPVAFRLLKRLWPKDYNRLTEKWYKNHNEYEEFKISLKLTNNLPPSSKTIQTYDDSYEQQSKHAPQHQDTRYNPNHQFNQQNDDILPLYDQQNDEHRHSSPHKQEQTISTTSRRSRSNMPSNSPFNLSDKDSRSSSDNTFEDERRREPMVHTPEHHQQEDQHT